MFHRLLDQLEHFLSIVRRLATSIGLDENSSAAQKYKYSMYDEENRKTVKQILGIIDKTIVKISLYYEDLSSNEWVNYHFIDTFYYDRK